MKKRGQKKIDMARYKGRYCCAVNCHNKEGIGNIRFFKVLRKDPIQTEKWIKAIDRKNPDGTPWIPGNRTRLCEKHFISGQFSTKYSARHPDCVPSIFPVKTLVQDIDPATELDSIEEEFNDEMSFDNESYLVSEKENDESAAKKPKIITVKPLIQHIDQKLITNLDQIDFSDLTPKSFVLAQRLTIKNLLESLKSDSKKGFKLPEEVKKALDVVKNCDIEIGNSVELNELTNLPPKNNCPTAVLFERPGFENRKRTLKIIEAVANTDSPVYKLLKLELTEDTPKQNCDIESVNSIETSSKLLKSRKPILTEVINPNENSHIDIIDTIKDKFVAIGNASFTRKTNLNNHISREKSFKCSKCDSTFPNKLDVNRHIDSVHEGKRPYKCSFCKVSFGIKQNLTRHVTSVHEKKKPFKCSKWDSISLIDDKEGTDHELCPKQPNSSENGKKHQKYHILS
jgi:uncharacterized C2H2 Zn-finger protein